MKWVIVDRVHVNTNNVKCFHWIEGRLYIRFGPDDSVAVRDPDREKYLRLCGQLGVRPVEVEALGEG